MPQNKNPILDEVIHSSTGDTMNAVRSANFLRRPFALSSLIIVYDREWGSNCANARAIIAVWYLTVLDSAKHHTTFVFDLVNRHSPPLVRLVQK